MENPFLDKKKILINNPNTFIGGVSATINTPALVAAYLASDTGAVAGNALLEGNIRNFKIIGSDIQFFVNIDYYVKASAFINNTNVTYFKNTDNRLKGWGDRSFQNASNLTEIKGDFAHTVWQICFSNTGLIVGDFPRVTAFAFGNSQLANIPSLITLNTPICVQYGSSQSVIDCMSGTTINIANIYTSPLMETINGGSVEADVKSVEDNGGTIHYVT